MVRSSAAGESRISTTAVFWARATRDGKPLTAHKGMGQSRTLSSGQRITTHRGCWRSSGLQRRRPALGQPAVRLGGAQGTGYRWWLDRLRVRLDYLDATRIDHFRAFEAALRAFEAAWHGPAQAASAASGQWIPGPGSRILRARSTGHGQAPIACRGSVPYHPSAHGTTRLFLPECACFSLGLMVTPNNRSRAERPCLAQALRTDSSVGAIDRNIHGRSARPRHMTP